MKKIILIYLLIISSVSFAKFVQTSNVRYYTSQGWSQYYTVDVLYLSGQELNDATLSFNYDSFNYYGIIFWGNDKATIIELDGVILCGIEFLPSCINSFLGNIQGIDQIGRKWDICNSSYLCN